MSLAAPRLLFVPVSGPRGMGEYARALALATAASRRWPQADIHFALSAQAPYAADTPFPKTLLPSSPTFHTPEVTGLIRSFRPDVVLFDNAGRTAQLRAARACGARVVYVSSRIKQRRKAFRLRWMRLIDEHWIGYPEFIAGGFSWLERAKLRLLKQPMVRYIDVLLPEPDPAAASATMHRLGVTAGDYVLIVPGGGTAHRGAMSAPEIITAAARQLAARGQQTLLVGVPSSGSDAGDPPALQRTPRLPLSELAELMRAARLVVSNGGDTLLQVLACHRPCVAVPIAHDQAFRITRCEEEGLVVGAKLDAAAIEQAVLSLLSDTERRERFLERMRQNRIVNGTGVTLEALARLIAAGRGSGS